MYRLTTIIIILFAFVSIACKSERDSNRLDVSKSHINITSKDSIVVNKLTEADTVWAKISDGINILKTSSRVKRILLCFAGQGVSDKMCMNWGRNILLEDTNRLGIGTLVAIRGANEVYFKNKELNLKLLADELLKISKDNFDTIEDVVVIGHSSGVFVAHEFFSILFDRNNDKYKSLYGKISFFSLDGAIGKNQGIRLTDNSSSKIKHIYGVIAEDTISKIKSARAKDVIDLCNYFKEKSTLITLYITQPNCGANAKWYLHEALVNKVPHSKMEIDLYNDYLHFDSKHRINIDYLKSFK